MSAPQKSATAWLFCIKGLYRAINDTSAVSINGTFSNLPEGAIVNVNGNNLQASYEGGGGNDLTLVRAGPDERIFLDMPGAFCLSAACEPKPPPASFRTIKR
jgi:hypothetical protein